MGQQSRILIPPLSPADTDLNACEAANQIIAKTSPWLDLCSTDPLVAEISKQILELEIAYAAFCGCTYVLIPGPTFLTHQRCQAGLMQFSRAIQQALTKSPFMQLYVWWPMIDHPENDVVYMGDLTRFARTEHGGKNFDGGNRGLDLYGTWDAWNVVRSFCRYNARLSIGMMPA